VNCRLLRHSTCVGAGRCLVGAVIARHARRLPSSRFSAPNDDAFARARHLLEVRASVCPLLPR
jgi:hypothetical protein